MKYNDNGEWKDIQVKVANAIQNEYGESNNDGYSQNYLNDRVVNVGTEVDEDYRVNLLETKNLFTITSVLPNTALNNNVVFSSSEWDIFVIPVEIGTTYTLSKTSYNGGILSFNTTFPKINDTVNNAQTLRNISTLIFEAKDNYLCLMIAKSDDKTTIQVEKGSTATTYSSFMQNQIVVDNEKYSDTLNVGTSVDSRSRVNFIKSRNLYNKSTDLVGQLLNNSGVLISNSTWTTSDTINVNGNTPLTISLDSEQNTQLLIGEFSSSNSLVNYSSWDFRTGTKYKEKSITTNANTKYVRIGYRNDLTTGNIMLTETSSWQQYEPYITPSIYVDNEMLVSKNVYSTGEVVIGEWLGKPLYRKVIDFGVLPNNATKIVYHNISNLDFITKVEGISKRSVGDFFTIPYIAGANTGNITLYANSAQIVIITYSDRSTFDKTYIVIEYTKTTD